MSFNVLQLHEWLDEAQVPHRLLRADGTAWGPEQRLADIVMQAASLDSRQVERGTLFVGVAGENVHGGRFLGDALEAGASAALIEGEVQGISARHEPVILVEDGRAALAALTRGYLAALRAPVVGITGSNGKTTTKDFTRAALEAKSQRVGANPGNLNSGWGLPVAVLGQRGDESVLVLEMGASAPGEIGYLADMARPRVGCVTNIATAHLERFGSIDGVFDAKAELLDRLPFDGAAVVPRDDVYFKKLMARSGAKRIISFGRARSSDVCLEHCEQTSTGLRVRVDGVEGRLRIFGEANGLNVAAACAIARAMGIETADALPRICETRLSDHRSALLTVRGRVILDDCYNANPASMKAALQSLAKIPIRGKRIAVLGSMAELGPRSDAMHAEVVTQARALGVDRVVPVGEVMSRATGDPVRDTVAPEENPADQLALLGRWVAASTSAGDAILFKASRSVGLEHALESFLTSITGDRGES